MITVVDDDIIVPRRIGFCANPKGDGSLGSRLPCGSRIMSDDIEALEMPDHTHICGRCVDEILRDTSGISYSPLAR